MEKHIEEGGVISWASPPLLLKSTAKTPGTWNRHICHFLRAWHL